MGEKVFDINKTYALIFENDDKTYTLSPFGCFIASLTDTGILDDDVFKNSENQKARTAFKVLVKVFEDNGFIHYEDGKPVCGTKQDQIDLFKKTVGTYFRDATDDMIETAFEQFMLELKEHGNAYEFQES